MHYLDTTTYFTTSDVRFGVIKKFIHSIKVNNFNNRLIDYMKYQLFLHVQNQSYHEVTKIKYSFQKKIM